MEAEYTVIRGLGQKEAMEDTFKIRPARDIYGTTMLVTAVRARRFRSTMRV